ncbi:MAG: sulfotransferase [Phycisphaerales bacterium]|nr:sulfotransferase [Phycisphaerales bacterium]
MSAQADRAIRQQAQAMIQGGHLNSANELLREHVQKRARDHEAFAIMGQIASMERRLDDAESMLMRALRGDRKRADYHALLGEILMTSGRHKEAIARFEQAAKLHTGYDAAYAGMAEACLRMGDVDRAMTVLTKGPDTPITAVPHVRALIRHQDFEAAIALVHKHLPATNSPQDVQRGLWFAKASACERAGRFAEAFEAASQGNALSAGSWSSEQALAMQRDMREIFSADSIKSLPIASNQDDSPVFIVGLLRSGSTLTEQIIDAHSTAFGAGESELLPGLLTSVQEKYQTMVPWPAALREINEVVLDEIAKEYLSEIRRMAPGAVRIADKQLGNLLNLGAIQLLFPRARVVHCVRHPMDLGLSCWMQKLPPGTNHWASDLNTIGEMIRLADELMTHWKSVLDLPILEVRYENMVANLDAEVERLLHFCDLTSEPACLRFWESGRTVLTLSSDQVRRPIYASSVDRHRAWGEHLDPLRDALGNAVEQYESESPN